MTRELYDRYVELGFKLAPLDMNTKKPQNKRKKGDACNDKTYAYNKNRTYYAVPTEHWLVIDVDVKDDKVGLESLDRLRDDLLHNLEPTVVTGSGGLHIYCKVETPVKAHQELYPDIDFQCYRADEKKCPPYVVCGGQEFEFEGKPYKYEMLHNDFVINELGDVTDILEEDLLVELNDDIGDFDIPTEHPERAMELLYHINPCCDEPTWFKIASALKNEVVDGFKVFDEWSKGCPDKYDEKTAVDKWEKTKPKGNVGVIYNIAKNFKLKKTFDFIAKAKTKKDLEKMTNSKRWNSEPFFKDEALTRVAEKIKEKFEVTLPDARKLLLPKEIEVNPDEVNMLREIVYVESYPKAQKYVVIKTGEKLSNLAMTGRYRNELEIMQKYFRMKELPTFDTLVKKGLITSCSDHRYIPHKLDKVVVEKGVTYYNLFNPDSLPEVAEEFSGYGQNLIDKFVKHLKYTMEESEVKVLLDYLAYTAQNIGKKVLWCPLIQSEQGLGKSILGKIMINHIFGQGNSGIVDSTVVNSPQTSWATNSVFKVLEEIKLDGHNRYEVINRLKPFITEPTVSRVEKYEASSEVPNYTNFIAFTNYKDAIPLKDGDRRWWVVFYKVKNLDELEKVTGQNRSDYFEPLYTLLYSPEYGKEFKKWLLDYKISSDFKPNFPPDSLHKNVMIATEETKTEYLSEIKELISENFKGVTEDVVSTKAISSIMLSDVWDADVLQTKAVSALLRQMGYSKFPKRYSYKGEKHYLWGKNISYEEAKTLFVKSMDSGKDVSMFDDLDLEDF